MYSLAVTLSDLHLVVMTGKCQPMTWGPLGHARGPPDVHVHNPRPATRSEVGYQRCFVNVCAAPGLPACHGNRIHDIATHVQVTVGHKYESHVLVEVSERSVGQEVMAEQRFTELCTITMLSQDECPVTDILWHEDV
jgi:hypothetical protein